MWYCFRLQNFWVLSVALVNLSTASLAKYLLDCKAPVTTEVLDEPRCFIYIIAWLYSASHSIQGSMFLSLSLYYYLPSMGLELANLDSDFLYTIILPC
jgi:hypothetical protein